MFFSYFPLFSEADSSQGGLKTVTWSPATRAKFAEVLTYDYMSEEDTDPTHPQRQRTVIPFAWGKRRTAHDEGAIGQSRDGPVNSQG